jgi:1-acyl-sn-glycerol-3-phosphate acyltransferase
MARALLRRPIRLLWPLALSGGEHVPATGPAILCPNHLSFFDSVFMMLAFDRPVYLIGKAEYLDSWSTRRLFPAMGMIPIDRDSGPRAMIALDAAAEVLRAGGLLCIYPEGTRSRDGRLHRGHTGAARLARTVDCPLVPVGIRGTAELQPPGAKLPRIRRRCSIAVGAPLMASSAETNGRAARAVTDELMLRISTLGGQEYVASYSPRPTSAVATSQATSIIRSTPIFSS